MGVGRKKKKERKKERREEEEEEGGQFPGACSLRPSSVALSLSPYSPFLSQNHAEARVHEHPSAGKIPMIYFIWTTCYLFTNRC